MADTLLNLSFGPKSPDKVWVAEVAYLRTSEDWLYLAIFLNLCSRCIADLLIDKRMTTGLVHEALIKAYNLCRPLKGWRFMAIVLHSTLGEFIGDC